MNTTFRFMHSIGLMIFILLVLVGMVSMLPILIRLALGLMGFSAVCAVAWAIVGLVKALMADNTEETGQWIIYLAGLVFILWYLIPGMSGLLPSASHGPECIVYDYGSKFCEEYDYPAHPIN